MAAASGGVPIVTGIQRADVNLKLMTTAVENFTKLAGETRADARPDSYVETSTGRTSPQVLAEEKFKQTLDLLNSQVNGRYLFSGRTSDVQAELLALVHAHRGVVEDLLQAELQAQVFRGDDSLGGGGRHEGRAP